MKKMIVVGGGAAGMMTAIHAAENYKVILLEKNDKLGKKLFITGKGRCNLTNACDEETFLKNVMSNPKFLYSAVSAYPPEAVIRSFQDWGLKVKTERGNRIFPESDHSSDVIRTLEQDDDIRYVICPHQPEPRNGDELKEYLAYMTDERMAEASAVDMGSPINTHQVNEKRNEWILVLDKDKI